MQYIAYFINFGTLFLTFPHFSVYPFGYSVMYIVFGSNTGPGIVTADGWKLRYYLSRNEIELFFLPDDPQELNDLSSTHLDKVHELKRILLKECGGTLQNGVNKAG